MHAIPDSLTVHQAVLNSSDPQALVGISRPITDAEDERLRAYLGTLDAGPDHLIGPDPGLCDDFRTIMFGGVR